MDEKSKQKAENIRLRSGLVNRNRNPFFFGNFEEIKLNQRENSVFLWISYALLGFYRVGRY